MAKGVLRTDTPACGAPRRGEDGERCGRPAGAGTDHLGSGPCSWHGGALPSVAAHHRDELVLQEARRGLARLGVAQPLESVEQAYDLLLSVAGQLDALRQGLQDEVERLGSVRYEHDRSGEQIRGEVTVLVAVTKELTSLLSTIGRLDVQGRKVALDEARYTMMARLVELALADHGVDATDSDVRATLHRHALALEAGEERTT